MPGHLYILKQNIVSSNIQYLISLVLLYDGKNSKVYKLNAGCMILCGPNSGVFPAQRSAAPSCSPLRRAGFTDIPHFAFIMEISLRDCETNTGVIELGQPWGFHSAHAVTAVYPTFEWSWKVLSQRVRAGSSGAAMPGLPGFLSSSDLPPLLPLLHHKCCHMFT